MTMNTITLANLRLSVEELCGLPTIDANTTINLVMANRWLNRSVQRLTALLSKMHGDEWNTATGLVSTTAGSGTVSLPSLCFRLKRVVWVRGTQDIVPLRRANPDEWLGATEDARTWEGAPVYALQTQALRFWPVPSAVYSLRLYYVKLLAALSVDADTLEFAPGWDDWVLADTCVLVATRLKEDVSLFLKARSDAQELVEAGVSRDEDQPQYVRRATRALTLREEWNRSGRED